MKIIGKFFELLGYFVVFALYAAPEAILIYLYVFYREHFNVTGFTLETDGIAFGILAIWPLYLLYQVIRKHQPQDGNSGGGGAGGGGSYYEPPKRKIEMFYGDGGAKWGERDNYGNYHTDSGKTYRPTDGGGYTSNK